MKKNGISRPCPANLQDATITKWDNLPSNLILVHTLTMGNAEGNSLLMQLPAEEALARRDIISTSLIDLTDRKSRDVITFAEIVLVLDVPGANILYTCETDACTPDNSFYQGSSLEEKAKLAGHYKSDYYQHGYSIKTPEHLVAHQNASLYSYNEVVIVAKAGVTLRKNSPATGRVKVTKLLLLPDRDQVGNNKVTDKNLLKYWDHVKGLNPGLPSDIRLPETSMLSFCI
jgi:hypothetical protein